MSNGKKKDAGYDSFFPFSVGSFHTIRWDKVIAVTIVLFVLLSLSFFVGHEVPVTKGPFLSGYSVYRTQSTSLSLSQFNDSQAKISFSYPAQDALTTQTLSNNVEQVTFDSTTNPFVYRNYLNITSIPEFLTSYQNTSAVGQAGNITLAVMGKNGEIIKYQYELTALTNITDTLFGKSESIVLQTPSGSIVTLTAPALNGGSSPFLNNLLNSLVLYN